MYLRFSDQLFYGIRINGVVKCPEILKSEYRAVIKSLTLEKQPANNIRERLVNVYGDSVAEFKRTYLTIYLSTNVSRPIYSVPV